MNLLTRREAAAHLRIGLSTFDRHVQPFVPSIRIGKRVMFQREDLDTWVVRQKDSKSFPSEAGTTFASTRGDGEPLGEARVFVARQFPAEYRCWQNLRQRCSNAKNPDYANYGGRGIAVCERWQTFAYFLEDMGPRPQGAKSVDRIDSNGNYDPANCRWATPFEQAQNRRTCRMLTYAGRTQNLVAWARELGIAKMTIRRRLAAGWTVARALSEPAVTGTHWA